MAIATDKLIIPLKVDTNPYGFLGSIQALKVIPDEIGRTCGAVARAIARRPHYRVRFLDGLIRMFAESVSYDEAGRYVQALMQFDGYSPQQVRDILLAVVENGQINHCFKAQRRLPEFIRQYSGEVDKDLVRKAKAALRD